jgi:hypothetical protein
MPTTINSECQSVLEELEYISVVPRSDQIISNIIKKYLEQIGRSYSKAILYNMCSLYNLSEYELLTNYDLFEKSLNSILGKSGKAILTGIKKEILTYAVSIDSTITIGDIRNPQLTVGDILKPIRTAETLDFIHKNPSNKHIAFLYRNESSKSEILTAFFDTKINSKALKGLLLSKKPSTDLSHIVSHVDNIMLYEELLEESQEDEVLVASKLAHWIANLHSLNESGLNDTDNRGTRIVSEDVTWWPRNGFARHYMDFEKAIGRCPHDDLSVLCGYNISEYNDEKIDDNNNGTIDAMIATHGYVILDEPFIVYRAPGILNI